MTHFKERIFEYPDVSTAYKDFSFRLIQEPHIIDTARGTFNYRMAGNDATIIIEHPTSNLNIAENSFQYNRWEKRFLPEYFELESFRYFLQFLKKRKGNDAQSYSYICPSRARHSLGNCLLAVSVRTGKKGPRISLHSRSCYFQPTGCLDLSFGAALADYVREVVGVEVPLIWHIDQYQTNAWKIIPWLLNNNMSPYVFTPSTAIQERYLKNMIDAINWAREDHDPNPRYMFYRRMIKKMHAIWARQESGIELPILIPRFPEYYFTDEPITVPVLPYTEDEDDDNE